MNSRLLLLAHACILLIVAPCCLALLTLPVSTEVFESGAPFDIIRASVSTKGHEAIENSFHPSISADGSLLVFHSRSSNLVPDTSSGPLPRQIFLYNNTDGSLSLVSVNSKGEPGNADSVGAVISGDGSKVAFTSAASNLGSNDNNSKRDIYVRNLRDNTITSVSVSSKGQESDQDAGHLALSYDGRYVAYDTYSALSNGDRNSERDVYVIDMQRGTTTPVSVSSKGAHGNGISQRPSISADGRFIAFESTSTNLVDHDRDSDSDIYLRDTLLNITILVSSSSPSPSGKGNGPSSDASISPDGRYIAFASYATNWFPGVTTDSSVSQVYLYDRLMTRNLSLISLSPLTGKAGSKGSFRPSVSEGARFISFWSHAADLFVDDMSEVGNVTAAQIVVCDVSSRKFFVASMNVDGEYGNQDSYDPSISYSGKYLSYSSIASNLDDDQRDTNGKRDIFLAIATCGSECESSPHAQCADDGSHMCVCAPGWGVAYPNCSQEVPVCDPPCDSAHGRCVAANTCACDAGWQGDPRCSTPTPSLDSSSSPSSGNVVDPLLEGSSSSSSSSSSSTEHSHSHHHSISLGVAWLVAVVSLAFLVAIVVLLVVTGIKARNARAQRSWNNIINRHNAQYQLLSAYDYDDL